MASKKFDAAAAADEMLNKAEKQEPRKPEAKKKKETYRYNLCLDMALKPFLMKIAWEQKKPISQYLSDLIAAEQEKYLQAGGVIEDEWKER